MLSASRGDIQKNVSELKDSFAQLLTGFIQRYTPGNEVQHDHIDYLKTKYDPKNEMHQKHIRKYMTSFSQRLNALIVPDQVALLSVTLAVLCALTQYLHPLTCVVPAAIVVYVVLQHLNRPEKVNRINQDLKELYAIYRWCAKDATAAITHDRNFINVLEGIAPFVKTKDLLLWNFFETKQDDISPEFATILAKAPHSIPVLISHPKKFDELLLEVRKGKTENIKWPALFQDNTWRTIAAKLYCYDVQDEKNSTQLQR